jgi:hypothetical protein
VNRGNGESERRGGVDSRTSPFRRFPDSPVPALAHALAGLLAAATLAARADDFVPFPIAPDLPAGRLWAGDLRPIAPDGPRIEARDGHFSCEGRRVRLWGVNLSLAANLPRVEDAPMVAQRMAAAGINSVRLHHLDSASFPRGIWDAGNPGALHPEALHRLDVFIDQLARRGIWVNLNLHVGRQHSTALGLPDTGTKMDKIAGIFTPGLIDAQKKYARDVLARVNGCRSVRYADDAAIAIVEISNEDSLFMWDAPQKLPSLPDYYARILRQRYNDWLKSRYGTVARLDAAWSRGAESLGSNLLTNGAFASTEAGRPPAGWAVEQHAGCRMTAEHVTYQGMSCLKLIPEKSDDINWHLQFNTSGLTIEKGRYYTVRFKAAAESPREVACSVGQAHEPWRSLGLWRPARLTPEWQTFEFGFTATESDARTRLSFALGGAAAASFLADAELCPGGRSGRSPREHWDDRSIALFGDTETDARARDRMLFLADVEKGYFEEMRAFIRKDLGSKALVTGTVVFGPLAADAQRGMDFMDAHAYWHHPRFPGRPWDANNWTIEQEPMSGHPQGGTFPGLAFSRVEGKPFTVSEYNHPAPNDYQEECVPLIASFAAAQDWDGVWLYTYSHGQEEWREDWYHGYFDIQANPAKFGFIPAGAAIFRDAGIAALPPSPTAAEFDDPASAQQKYGGDLSSAAREATGAELDQLWKYAWRVSLRQKSTRPATEARQPPALTWKIRGEQPGAYFAAGDAAMVFTGAAGCSREISGGRLEIQSPSFAALTLTSLDGLSFDKSRSLLVTACGRAENVNMGFSADRRTLGTNWGGPPSRIEAVAGRVRLPPGDWKASALAPDGSARSEVPVQHEGGTTWLPLAPASTTMWYRLTRP